MDPVQLNDEVAGHFDLAPGVSSDQHYVSGHFGPVVLSELTLDAAKALFENKHQKVLVAKNQSLEPEALAETAEATTETTATKGKHKPAGGQ